MWQRWLLVILFATYLIHEAWTLFPDSSAVFKMFPFSDQVISKQYYVFLVSQYVIWIIVFGVIYVLIEEGLRDVVKWFLVFQCLELIEFFLTYNEPLLRVKIINIPVGINITNIKVVVMFVLVTSKVITWNPGK